MTFFSNVTTETWANIIGYGNGTVLIISFIFQNYTVFRNKQATDVSYWFLALQMFVNVSYIIYGILLLIYPLIYANSGAALLLTLLIVQKIIFANFYHKNKETEVLLDIDKTDYSNYASVTQNDWQRGFASENV